MTITVESLQVEIEKLKDKNTQLLNEKRAMQAQRDDLAEKLAAADELLGITTDRLEYITVQLPRNEVLEQCAVSGSAELLGRELNYHFDIVRGEDGRDMLHTKTGEPATVQGDPVELTEQGIRSLYESGALKTIGSLLKSSGATGGGATGSVGQFSTLPQRSTPKAVQFGMR